MRIKTEFRNAEIQPGASCVDVIVLLGCVCGLWDFQLEFEIKWQDFKLKVLHVKTEKKYWRYVLRLKTAQRKLSECELQLFANLYKAFELLKV